MLSWKDIYLELRLAYTGQLMKKKPEQRFSSLIYLKAGIRAENEECLYLIKASLLNQDYIADNISIIIFKDIEKFHKIPENVANCAIVYEDIEFEELYNKLVKLFSYQSRVQYLLQWLIERYSYNDGLQKIVDAIAELFKLPVSILDISFAIIVHSRNYSPICGCSKFIGETDISPKMISYMREKGYNKTIENSDEIVKIELEPDSVYFMPIFLEKVRVGYMTIYESPIQSMARLDKEFTYFIPTIASFLGVEMQRNNLYTLNKARYYSFIFSMIFEKKSDVNEIKERLKIFQYDLKRYMYLMSVKLNESKMTKMDCVLLADSLKALFVNSIYMIQDNEILFLTSRNERNKINDEEIGRWDEFLRKNHLNAGITGPFEDFSYIQERYEETQLVLKAREKNSIEGGLYVFSKNQIEAMFELLPKGKNLYPFCFEPLMKLIEYDRCNNTELIVTLQEYIRHPKQTKEICEQLHIHKNTLYKRLDRIRDVMGIEFEDAENIMRIQFTFHILKYINS